MSTKLTQASVRVSLATTTARSALLPPGNYQVTCDVDCFILQGGSAVDAVLATSNVLWSKGYIKVRVGDASDGYIAGILASGTGTLHILKVLD